MRLLPRRSPLKVLSLVAALAVVALLAVAAGSLGSAAPSATKRVSVRDDFFSPRSTSVRRRDRVTWVWRADNPHNVRFRRVPRGAARGGSTTKTRGRFSRTFRKRGRYSYVCTIHVDIGMRGSVRVR